MQRATWGNFAQVWVGMETNSFCYFFISGKYYAKWRYYFNYLLKRVLSVYKLLYHTIGNRPCSMITRLWHLLVASISIPLQDIVCSYNLSHILSASTYITVSGICPENEM